MSQSISPASVKRSFTQEVRESVARVDARLAKYIAFKDCMMGRVCTEDVYSSLVAVMSLGSGQWTTIRDDVSILGWHLQPTSALVRLGLLRRSDVEAWTLYQRDVSAAEEETEKINGARERLESAGYKVTKVVSKRRTSQSKVGTQRRSQ